MKKNALIYIGTSGYSYNDWKGNFYPEHIKPRDMLSYYSSRFPAVELNFSFYAMPKAKTVENIRRQVWDGFLFSVKAPGIITHEGVLDRDTAQAFCAALEPLTSAGALAAALFQFPFSFKNTPENIDYLKRIKESFPGLALVIEFRHSSWVSDSIESFLKELSVSTAAVDMPALEGLVPPSEIITAEPAYVRFHGRNKKKWWNHKQSYERYEYLYSKEELEEWVPRILDMAGKCDRLFVLMNNHFGGRAPRSADLLWSLLLEQGAELAQVKAPQKPRIEPLSLF